MANSTRDRLTPMRKTALALLFLALSWPASAGLVARPSKTCGTTTYVSEVAAGCVTIKSSEVDADLNAIITGGVNNIETANINAAGLGTTAYANLSVTQPKLAVGAAVSSFQSADFTAGSSSGTVELTILTLPSITTRGGRVVLFGFPGTRLTFNVGGVGTFRLKRAGVTQRTWSNTGAGVGGEQINAITFVYVDTPAAGSYVYTLTYQANASGALLTVDATNPGIGYALELS